MPDRQPLILIGSSVRAAAQSAVRAGFAPWCIDQFGDEDLKHFAAEVQVVADWPMQIPDALAAFSATANEISWLYTGALENHQELIESLSRKGKLRGCNADILRKVRDPKWIADTLTNAAIPALPVLVPATGGNPSPPDSECGNTDNWMMKPLRSGAGIGVHELRTEPETEDLPLCYLQKKAIGQTVSGLYLGFGSSARLLGMCEQLCGEPAAGAKGHLYSGSLGPLSVKDLPRPCFEQAQYIGSAITRRLADEGLSMAGLFGIDFIFDSDYGELWTLEINPRYPASVELYERAFDWPLMRWHVDACVNADSVSRQVAVPDFAEQCVRSYGKLIVYAPNDFVAPNMVQAVRKLNHQLDLNLSVADIPRVGTSILQNQPVCTILASAPQTDQCRAKLLSGGLALQDLVRNRQS